MRQRRKPSKSNVSLPEDLLLIATLAGDSQAQISLSEDPVQHKMTTGINGFAAVG
jgi:hypothetical protein